MLTGALFLVCIGLFVWWFYRRSRSRRSAVVSNLSYVILHDGRTTTIYRAERTDTGSFMVAGAEYPPSLVSRVDNATNGDFSLYMIAIEPVALIQHRELERVRAGILVGNIFKPAGEFTDMLRMAAAVVVILCTLFIYTQVSALNTSLVRQEAQMKVITEKVSNPLVIQK